MPKSAPVQPDHLTDQTTLHCTIKVLERYFNLAADGYLCHTRDLYQIVVTAAARCSTLEATCRDLQDAPDSNTVREYCQAQLPREGIAELERACNRALRSQWPHWLWSQPLQVAADLHDECYYGAAEDEDPDSWVCRGEKRNGTTRFYRCATLAVIRQRFQLTLAVAFVHPDDDDVTVLHKLLKTVQSRGLRLGCLYADKQFCTIPVLRYLNTQTTLAAILAVPRKGKAGGVNGLCHGCQSYRTTHTFASRPYGQWTVPVAVVRAFKTEHGQRTGTWLVYVLLRVDASLRRIRESYRERFGIETQYRCMEHVRARTTSKNPAFRFFLMGVALVLVNVWIALQWTHCRRRGSGPRRIAGRLFTLDRMVHFLIHAVEAEYGVVSEVTSPKIKSVIY
jgi:putative transposase